jgi:hypothetical protein
MSESVEGVGLVLFAREEERVPRRSSVSVAKSTHHAGVAFDPLPQSVGALRDRCASPKRLEVIADGDEQVDRAVVRSRATEQVTRIAA